MTNTWLCFGGLILGMLFATSASAHFVTWSTAGLKEASRLRSTLIELRDQHQDLDELTFDWNGDWVVIAGSQVHHSSTFPTTPLRWIRSYIASGRQIDAVAFTPSGHWAIVAEDYLRRSNGLPEVELLTRKIQQRQAQGRRITELAFTANNRGWTVISGSWAYSYKVPVGLFEAIRERRASKRTIRNISIGNGNAWLLVADQWFASDGLSPSLLTSLKTWQRLDFGIDRTVLGPGPSFVMYGGTHRPDLHNPIQCIENSLGEDDQNIYQRMRELKIPGVSLAVVDRNQVVAARGYGTLEAGTQKWVRSSSPFAVGSISKLVAAVGTTSVAEDTGLSLSYSLANFHGVIQEWIREGRAHPEIYGTHGDLPLNIKVWLLLSHMAHMNNNSIEIHPDAWAGGPDSTLATLLGYFCERSGCSFNQGKHAWYNASAGQNPGTEFHYSNKGFLVAQAILETVTGKSYEALIGERIFEPLGMIDSGFSMPLSPAIEQRAATRHDKSGNPIARYLIPNSAAGGLYSTPTDYAQLVIMLMNDGSSASGSRILSPNTVDAILTDRTGSDDNGIRYGYGVELLSFGTFAHGGAVKGGSSCMEADRDFDQALIVVTNAPIGPGRKLMKEIRLAFREAYDWPLQSRPYRRAC